MDHVELGTVVAERVLHSAALQNEVRVRIGCPQKTAADDFITPYQIIGVGDQKIRFAAGLDAVQSLQLAFVMIGADIHSRLSDYGLRWADGEGPGFPVP